MLDNQLLAIIIPALRTELALYLSANNYDMPPPLVDQNYQPTMQGANTPPSIYIHKNDNYRYGAKGRKDKWDGLKMVHTETQVLETTFQVDALVIQDPANTNQITASDLVNIAADIMSSDTFMNLLHQQWVGVLKISAVRNIPFKDDRDRFEYNPSFDFTVTHKSTTISQTPIITDINPGIYRI